MTQLIFTIFKTKTIKIQKNIIIKPIVFNKDYNNLLFSHNSKGYICFQIVEIITII